MGFITLTDSCQLIYNHSAYYTPGSEGGIRYNDKIININWPFTGKVKFQKEIIIILCLIVILKA